MKKWIFSGCAALLCVMFASQMVHTVKADSNSALDFSHKGNESVVVGPAEFIEKYLGLDLYEYEHEFFESSDDFAFKYSGSIAGKYLFADIDDDGQNVKITAKEYSYQAANVKTVVWRPYSIGEALFNGEVCITPVREEDFVTVTYCADVSLNIAPINGIINRYYDEAAAISKKLAVKESEYNAAMEQYNVDYALYEKYLSDKKQYNEDKVAYGQYLRELDAWKKRCVAYNKYLEELSEFERQTKDLEDYRQRYDEYIKQSSAYDKYLREYEAYRKEYDKYIEALKDPNIEKAKNHIAIIGYMDTSAGENRTLGAAITGSSVTTVLSSLSELDKYLPLAQVEKITITRAKTATDNLRNLISQYRTCTTDESKYSYYRSNYESLKQNFADLLRTLDYLYAKPMVKDEVKKQDKVEQFNILLAQLYYISNALDNELVKNYQNTYYTQYPIKGATDFDSTYRIDGKTPSAILGGVTLPDTNDAAPLSFYPGIPQEPVKPEEVPVPVYPGDRPPQPVKPDYVAEPGEKPEEVKEPTEPENIDEPTEPVPYNPTEWETALSAEFNGGKISRREEYSADLEITLYTNVKKYFRNAEGTINISFYLSLDDENPVFIAEMGRGDYIEYEGVIPTKTRRGYTCVWDGWSIVWGGDKVDMSDLYNGQDISLYPHFQETPNLYEVGWIINGVEYRTKAAYDSIPQYAGPLPQRPADDDGRQYKFKGWDRKIVAMTDKTVWYKAEFEASVLISFKVDSVLTVVSVWAGEIPEYDGLCEKPSDSYYYYEFSGWDRDITPAVLGKDERYTAQFDRNYILPLDSGGASVLKSEDGSVYNVDCSRSRNNSIEFSRLIDMVSGDGAGLNLRLSNSALSFSVDQVVALSDGGVSAVTVTVMPVVVRQYTYRVEFISLSGKSDYSFTFMASGVFDTVKTQLFRIDNEGSSIASRYTFVENSVIFQMLGGYTYELYPLYSVSVLQFEGISEFYASTSLTKPNQTILLTLGELAAGRTLDNVYVRDVAGDVIELSDDYTFRMPSADVMVGVVCGYIEYTVTFISEGMVISGRTYHYGDIVDAPAAFKSPDGEYSYTFVGWDKEIVPVTEDAEYIAVFKAELLPQPPVSEPSGKMKVLIWIGDHFLLIFIAFAFFVVLFITVIVLLVIRVKKRRKFRQKSA